MSIDPHGQPVNQDFNRARRIERDLSELLGLVKGLLADGVVVAAEAEFLRDWVAQHPDAANRWPTNRIASRLEVIFRDGQVSSAERSDLAELLRDLVGGHTGIIGGLDAATELPFDKPQPRLSWDGAHFVFTGKFAFGPRAECERHTDAKGGICGRSVTRDTAYLIVGCFGSRDWAHTSFGRKIEMAVSYRERGVPIAIVGEDHWAASLGN